MNESKETFQSSSSETEEDTDPQVHTSAETQRSELTQETVVQPPPNQKQNTSIPAKRPVGRPRKYPLLQTTSSTPKKVSRQPSLYDELESQGITAKDIQKYLLKKKVKKYVQQYVQKYQPQPLPANQRSFSSRYVRGQVDEEEEGEEEEEESFREIEESSEEENEQFAATSQTGGVGSNRQPEIPSQSKLDQIMGQRRLSSQPRYSSYRY
jgi:hypothetical protein